MKRLVLLASLLPAPIIAGPIDFQPENPGQPFIDYAAKSDNIYDIIEDWERANPQIEWQNNMEICINDQECYLYKRYVRAPVTKVKVKTKKGGPSPEELLDKGLDVLAKDVGVDLSLELKGIEIDGKVRLEEVKFSLRASTGSKTRKKDIVRKKTKSAAGE